MKRLILLLSVFLSSVTSLYANTLSHIKGEEVTYTSTDGTVLKGYISYDHAVTGKRPAILVIHEWWGSNDYPRKRADMLAALGYIALAVDMYGEGKQGNDPKEASALATPFYNNPLLVKERIEAAVNKIKQYPQTDDSKMACIGYCFGGNMSLAAAKLGMDFKGVVSFHGGLSGVPAQPGVTKAKILVCHGAADNFVPDEDVKKFRSNLDSVNAEYTFISYPNATHAFTNPKADELGKKFNLPIKYDAAADKKSWEDMKMFFKKIFS
jgi:dienelactone hydrolase